MSQTIELQLDERETVQLREAAERAGVTPQQFVQDTVLQALNAQDNPCFQQAKREVLEENRELFKRLAQ